MRTLQTLSQTAALLVLATSAQVASANCYLVYAPDESVVFRSTQSPVDLSQPLHMTLPAVAPGGRLVFEPEHHACGVETNTLDTLRKASVTPITANKRNNRQQRKARPAKAA